MTMTTLCDQGCGTEIYWKNNIAYNVRDDKPHKDTCMTLKIGTWWAGLYDTIPMGRIRKQIEESHEAVRKARKSHIIEDIIAALNTTDDSLAEVIQQMENQHGWNVKKAAEFKEYKTTLVRQQNLRKSKKAGRGK